MRHLSLEGVQIMDSLNNEPVASILKRLFQEAETADGPLMERYRDTGVTDDELAKVFAAEAKDYKALYHRWANNYLNVSADFGRFLYMCARAMAAKELERAVTKLWSRWRWPPAVTPVSTSRAPCGSRGWCSPPAAGSKMQREA